MRCLPDFLFLKGSELCSEQADFEWRKCFEEQKAIQCLSCLSLRVLQRATSLAVVWKASEVARKEMKKAEIAARSVGIASA